MKNTLIKTNKKYLPGLLNIAVPIMLSNLISQLQMLKMMGCKIFQGFYFSRPISVEEFEDKYLKI